MLYILNMYITFGRPGQSSTLRKMIIAGLFQRTTTPPTHTVLHSLPCFLVAFMVNALGNLVRCSHSNHVSSLLVSFFKIIILLFSFSY